MTRDVTIRLSNVIHRTCQSQRHHSLGLGIARHDTKVHAKVVAEALQKQGISMDEVPVRVKVGLCLRAAKDAAPQKFCDAMLPFDRSRNIEPWALKA